MTDHYTHGRILRTRIKSRAKQDIARVATKRIGVQHGARTKNVHINVHLDVQLPHRSFSAAVASHVSCGQKQ